MTLFDRISNYVRETGFPESIQVGSDGRIYGTLIMGADYRVKSGLYGGYPAGYLKRMKALFPEAEAETTLHLFSGCVDLAILPGKTVDINQARNPDFLDDAQTLRNVPLGGFRHVFADPPYSVEDCDHYGTTMINRNLVMSRLGRLPKGAFVIWLDQVLPMYSKDHFCIDGAIGMVKSTNHRFRMITIFRKISESVAIETDSPNIIGQPDLFGVA